MRKHGFRVWSSIRFAPNGHGQASCMQGPISATGAPVPQVSAQASGGGTRTALAFAQARSRLNDAEMPMQYACLDHGLELVQICRCHSGGAAAAKSWPLLERPSFKIFRAINLS